MDTGLKLASLVLIFNIVAGCSPFLKVANLVVEKNVCCYRQMAAVLAPYCWLITRLVYKGYEFETCHFSCSNFLDALKQLKESYSLEFGSRAWRKKNLKNKLTHLISKGTDGLEWRQESLQRLPPVRCWRSVLPVLEFLWRSSAWHLSAKEVRRWNRWL